MTGCHGPYDDLEGAFKASQPLSGRVIPVDSVVLLSPKHNGAYNYNGVLNVRLLPSRLEIEPSGPVRIFQANLDIPADAVSGCSRTCFGAGMWDANILISKTSTQIDFRNSSQVIDWCWANKIPMISGKDRRQWLYSGAALPDHSTFSEQLASRDKYDAQAKRSCLGY